MKKIIVVCTLIITMLLSTSLTWAETDWKIEQGAKGVVSPFYLSARAIGLDFFINSGTASYKATIDLKSGVRIDYAMVTTYIKKSSGTTVKTFQETITPSSTRIKCEGSYRLSQRGTYYAKCVVKLYRSNSLVETITKESQNDTY